MFKKRKMEAGSEAAAAGRVENKPMKSPHVWALLFGLAALCAVLTWIIPAGSFDRQEVNGRMMAVAGTYAQTESTPVGLWGLLMALPKGWADIANGIFMVFFVGAALKVMEVTGTLSAALNKLVVAFRGKELIGVCIISVVFSLLGMGDSLGMAVLAIVPLCVAVSRAMGFDGLVGLSMSYIAYHVGFSAGEINIFTTAIAQELADIPRFSGMGVRIFLHVVLLATLLYFTIRYAIKVKKDPLQTLCMADSSLNVELGGETSMSVRQIINLVLFIVTFIIIVYGAIVHSWSYQQFSAMFLALAIAAGLVGGLGINGTATACVNGCSGVAYGALVIGIARSISIILTEGGIMDTVVYWMSKPIAASGPAVGALLMFLANVVVNIFVPSGSGQAAVVMPLMIPLADVTGISRHVAVIAFQMGDGLNNFIIPTAAMLMASLGMIGIPYNKYLKWAFPIFLVHAAIAAVVIIALQLAGWC